MLEADFKGKEPFCGRLMAAKAPSDDAVGGVSQMTGLQFMIDDILLSLPVDEDGGTQFPS